MGKAKKRAPRLSNDKSKRIKLEGEPEVGWKADKELGRIRWKTKEKVRMFFDIEDRAVSTAYVLVKLSIDYETMKRILGVMVKHGELEKIVTNSKPVYRRVSKQFG